ncbi:MAG: SMC-Scp complex subunit ScpB [Armatimonadota bacterium]
MDTREIELEAQELEVMEVVSVQPMAEAVVAEVTEAASGFAVAHEAAPSAGRHNHAGEQDNSLIETSGQPPLGAREPEEPKRGRGLAALFSRKPRKRREEPEETEADIESAAALMESESPMEPTAVIEFIEDDSREGVPLHRNGKLRSVIECMLFVANEPLGSKQLADTLDLEQDRVEEAIKALEVDLDSRGLQLMKLAGGYQLCTKPEYADYCAMILQPAKRRLSKAALETLAVVAYRQPCTMPEIEAVRGVAVDGVMKTLIERGLAKDAGRKATPGRPILYATTPEFLEYFGLNDISELPDIDLLAVEGVKALEAQRELFSQMASSEDAPESDAEAVDLGSE